ncbi:CXXC motif containing zinc binding protein-like [Phoenix dactylifera]|uniref:CXXC motif containing zinc binding protein-like n=1 Tax=Phoenix dactylifera TaxID=42345 RepID=A0A8B9ATC3_PHODC|nr:CXXC motif containing zinc binding protein-like [Phoenix dactylifera]XP_038987163.1 CXXC motif containing zinc binding protein-like [Phoenix dactylifera]
MVFYMLYFTAELDNLTNFQPRGGCDDPNYPYYFKVKCENCGEISQKKTCVTMSESVPLPSGRGTANLVQKCKLCGREGSIQMIPGQGQPLTLELSQREQVTGFMVFDCRGFEPVDFSFSDGWKAESTSGTPFEVDLSGEEFADYDEKGECPVGVANLRALFRVVKKQERGGKTTFV